MSTLTTLGANDSGSTSRGVINTNFTNLNTDKAEIASPTFTGTPSLPTGTTAVTQSANDNSTKLATTAYVDNTIADKSCRVYQTGATTMGTAGDWTVMNFGAEAFDTDTMHDNSTNPSRITFTTAGKYLVGGTVYTTSNIDIGIKIRMDGTTDIAIHRMAEAYANQNGASVSTLYSFTAGQYIEFLASCSNTGDSTSGNSQTNAWAVRVSD
jgi:hypothetical protein